MLRLETSSLVCAPLIYLIYVKYNKTHLVILWGFVCWLLCSKDAWETKTTSLQDYLQHTFDILVSHYHLTLRPFDHLYNGHSSLFLPLSASISLFSVFVSLLPLRSANRSVSVFKLLLHVFVVASHPLCSRSLWHCSVESNTWKSMKQWSRHQQLQRHRGGWSSTDPGCSEIRTSRWPVKWVGVRKSPRGYSTPCCQFHYHNQPRLVDWYYRSSHFFADTLTVHRFLWCRKIREQIRNVRGRNCGLCKNNDKRSAEFSLSDVKCSCFNL